MGRFGIQIKPFGSKALLIEWPALVSHEISEDIQIFSHTLKKLLVFAACEYIPAYNSLTLIFQKEISFSDIKETILSTYSQISNKDTKKHSARTWSIPVCYDLEYGIDLEDMSARLGLSTEKIIEKHTSTRYTVYAIGFLPGFLYLGGLTPEIQVPRKTIPRLRIQKGDVGIAGQQTGIYPQASPGGWNIIGNTPIDMFDAKISPSTPVQAGDFIQFVQIDMAEHQRLSILEHPSLSRHNLDL